MCRLNKITILLSICILVLTWSACSSASRLDRLEGSESSSEELEVVADDVTLHVRIVGDPKAGVSCSAGADNVLIAIHGGPGMSSHYMISLEQLASAEFAVVTYDQRGTGRSTTPSDGYALLNHVADLEAVREAVGAEKVHIMGHSWGGVVAMRYATVHPQRVNSMVLMGSGPPSWQAASAGQGNRAQRIAELQQRGIIPQALSAIEDILPAYFSDPSFELPDELRNLHYSGTAEQLTWSAVGNYDFTAEAAELDHPVLMLWGEDDPFGLPMAEATQAALSAAEVEFVLLRECGHFWHECPDEFFSRVREFLELPPAP